MRPRMMLLFGTITLVLIAGAGLIQGWRAALFSLLGSLVLGGILVLVSRFTPSS